MTKKTFSKIIAMFCVAALLLGAVFTGAVSAAETATCTVTGYSYSQGAVDVYVGYEVTFASSTAFTAGSFKITSHQGLSFVDCTAKTSTGGSVPKVYLNVNNDKVLFAGFEENEANDFQNYTSLTLLLKFTPDTAIKDSPANTTWPITIGDISITNTAEATYNCSEVTATGAARAHVHNFGAWTGSGVQTRTCSICSAVDTRVQAGATLGSNNLAATKQATLNFTADGDTVLCALVPTASIPSGKTYFVYTYKDDTDNYKTATSVASGTTGAYTVFPCGRNGGIGRMSRNIKGNFINVPTSGATTVSDEWEYSIKTYLDTVISGSYSEADKNYAKALWNYGYYTTKRLKDTTEYFDDDFGAYTGGVKSVTDWTFPSSTAGETVTAGTGSWIISGVKVETGYKPKMHIKLNISGQATVLAYTESGDHVYKKTVAATSGSYFTISDIPTKYLTGYITVQVGSDSRVLKYSFGKYAKARISGNKDDANVFKWMMNYAYYLGQKFAN